MTEPAISIYNLSKRYSGSSVFALHELNLAVSPGEVYGYLGPNGAGKSTTIRLLLNFIQPSSGNAGILGLDVVRDSVKIKTKVGYLSGEVSLYPHLTGREFLEYMAELQPPKDKNYLKKLTTAFKAELNMKIRDLSKGNRQKLGIIQAFMHQPQVLILDEPTGGLDPLMQEEFFKLVDESKRRGASLFISSHNLSETQRICDRVGFIRGGKLIAEQDMSVNAAVDKLVDIAYAGKSPATALRKLKGVRISAKNADKLSLKVSGGLGPVLKVLSQYDIRSINQRDVSLEEEFLSFYKDTK